jgi:DNA topoisomerase-1
VKHGDVNATLPKETNLETLTLDEVLPLLAERAAATKKKGRSGGKTSAKAVARKVPAKKSTAATDSAATTTKSAKKAPAKKASTKSAGVKSAAKKSAKKSAAPSPRRPATPPEAPIDPDTLPF